MAIINATWGDERTEFRSRRPWFWQRCLSSTSRGMKAVAVTALIIIVSPFVIAPVLLAFSLFVAFTAVVGGALIALAIAIIVSVPVFFPFYMIIDLSLPRKAKRWIKEESDDNEGNPVAVDVLYKKARVVETIWVRLTWSSLGIAARVSLTMLVGLALSMLVPRLKRVTLLASPLWKWSLLSVTLTVGYFEVFSVVGAVVLVVAGVAVLLDKRSAAADYVFDLHVYITNVMYMGMVLATWLGYFGTDEGLKQASTPHHQAFEYVTWTIVSLFVGSILSLLKKLLLMKWSADAIYRRFEPRILITSVKYFFIGLAAVGFNQEGILLDLEVLDQCDPTTSDQRKVVSITKLIMSRKMDLGHLQYACHYLKSLAEIQSPVLERDDEEEEKAVVKWFSDNITGSTEECTHAELLKLIHSKEEKDELAGGVESAPAESIARRTLNKMPKKVLNILRLEDSTEKRDKKLAKQNKNKEEQEEKYRKMAYAMWLLVSEECSSSNFTYEDLKKWMVDAHKDCMNMGRTLVDATGIVSRLDLLMSLVISVIVILMWIILTGSASTAVLVSISTPFLALTFMFGDTAKTFFQGLIFCFASHPFDVGDRCILDNTELEVKSMNILTTTFSKIGSKEKKLYPNAVLITEPILNLGWQPDPNDVVELTLTSSINLKGLKKNVTEFFEREHRHNKYKNSYDMMIKEVGENVKVSIHFSHILTVHDLSHNQCFKKKSLQRSKLLNTLKKHINKQEAIPIGDVKNENNARPVPSLGVSTETKILLSRSASTPNI